MKAVTFTVKLTESNIELLKEFRENKQLGLLIRTYFDALAEDRGGTLANLIGVSGGDVVRNSITATTVVANHYKSYLDAGLKDKIEFSDYLADVEKFEKLPHEGYYGRGLTEKAVRSILENFYSELKLNNSASVGNVDETHLQGMVSQLVMNELINLGVVEKMNFTQKVPDLENIPTVESLEGVSATITPKAEETPLKDSETLESNTEIEEVVEPTMENTISNVVENVVEDEVDDSSYASDLLSDLGF